MTHQLVLVLIPELNDAARYRVDELLAEHSGHAQVRPYKVYFSPCHTGDRLWQQEDADAFVRDRHEKFGELWHRDENGWFQWRTDKPDGRFDFYNIGGRWNGLFKHYVPRLALSDPLPGNVCPVAELPPQLDVASIVTPDGTWHFFGWRWKAPGESDPIDEAGLDLIRRIRRDFSNCFAVVVDAHC
jgi:hypothetical protein